MQAQAVFHLDQSVTFLRSGCCKSVHSNADLKKKAVQLVTSFSKEELKIEMLCHDHVSTLLPHMVTLKNCFAPRREKVKILKVCVEVGGSESFRIL